ncbi:hypothetical protein QBC34DRAFT_494000 [Podospora aff. communis PSN243]|uniref:DUF7580 domain-containing protein n=1 Tax=Podospora aff. communis PSN243 TaxID=3040156 RepID=A0AAV9GP19_9PEZI|nr:hypothetical protein QBC34DRAFT_494000 [Podospora aff. communis PSN243]
MSGFEVAGIAIGSIPIIVSALKASNNALKPGPIHRWRFYARELKLLMRKLEVEHLKLLTVFERLLNGIVPDSQIDIMTNNPFGPLWKDPTTAERIQKRLGPSADAFESGVQEIREAMEEIGILLGFGTDGEITWLKCSRVKKELKRAQFALQWSDYSDRIARLRESVSALEDTIAKGIIFHVALSTPRGGSESTAIPTKQSDRSDLLQLSGEAQVKEDTRTLHSSRTTRLRFFLPPAAPEAAVRHATHSASNDTVDSSLAEDIDQLRTGHLCNFLQESHGEEMEKLYGRITDNLSSSPRVFKVHSLRTTGYGKEWALASLRSVLLQDSSVVSPPRKLLFGEKLELAWMIASSVVQLRGTSWLPRILTHNDIFFVYKEKGIRFGDVFLVNSAPESTARAATATAPRASPSPAALGILLIEVLLGQTIDQLRPPQAATGTQTAESRITELVSDYRALIKLLGKVNAMAGPNYSLAVRSCIKCQVYDDDDPHGEDPQHGDVFFAVLRLLESDMENVMECDRMNDS